MRNSNFHSPLAACTLAALLLLSGCGGGGASAPGDETASSGFVVDGYVRGATVLCDTNNNGSADAGETSILTDSSGFFRFSPACGASLVATGGTNLDTGLPFVGTMQAPAGSKVVTPLTTLVSAGMTVGQVNTALGLPAGTDVLNADPARELAGALTNGELMKKSLAVQQLVQKTTEVLAALGGLEGDAARPAIYSEVMAALAATLMNGSALATGATLDQAVISGFVRAATLRVAASTMLSTEVRGGAQSVNADSLGQVIAGALKVQAEAILQADDDAVTSATLIAQSDTQISTFVQASKTQIALAPNAETTGLGASLKNQVMSSLDGSRVLVSFDAPNRGFIGEVGRYGGALVSLEAPPDSDSGLALKIVKPVGATDDNGMIVPWGGAFVDVAPIPFTADRKIITARVRSTRAGAIISLKVQVTQSDAVEVASAPLAAADTWYTATWNLSGVSTSKSYTVIAITPDGTTPTSGQSYYIDQITLAPAAPVTEPPPPVGTSLVSFDESPPAFSDMGGYGGGLPTVENGPAGGSGLALKIVKPAVGGGVFFRLNPIPFTADRKVLSARVNSTRAGAVIRLKVEVSQSDFVEVDSTPVVEANTWTTVTWHLNRVNPSKVYNLIAITPDATATTAAGQTYFIDQITLDPAPPPRNLAPGAAFFSFDESPPFFTDMGGYGGALPSVVTLAGSTTGNSLRIVKPAGQQPWGGVFFGMGFYHLPFTDTNKTITAQVYSTRANAVIAFKVEAGTNDAVEVSSGPIPANTWTTVTWDFSAVDLAKTYNIIAITPDLTVTPAGNSYYIDDIKVIQTAP